MSNVDEEYATCHKELSHVVNKYLATAESVSSDKIELVRGEVFRGQILSLMESEEEKTLNRIKNQTKETVHSMPNHDGHTHEIRSEGPAQKITFAKMVTQDVIKTEVDKLVMLGNLVKLGTGKDIVILTGMHGAENGDNYELNKNKAIRVKKERKNKEWYTADSKIYTGENYERFEVKNIALLSYDQMKDLYKSTTKHVILGWCYSYNDGGFREVFGDSDPLMKYPNYGTNYERRN